MEPDTQSERPGRSHASKSTVVDTQSEPPGLSYMNIEKIQKRRYSNGGSVKPSAPSSAKPTATGASSASACTESRSVVTSSSNASKLNAKLQSSTRSQNNAATSRSSKSRATATAASSKSKDPSLAGGARSTKSKSSNNESVSTNNKLALVPKSRSKVDSQSTVNTEYLGTIDEKQQDPLPSEMNESGFNRLNTIDSSSGNESPFDQNYEDNDDDDQSGDSYTRATKLASAVERALVERRESLQPQKKNELVQYEGKNDRGDDEGKIVSAKGRYLAAAVDNMGSVVPVDSDIYEAYDHTFVTCPEYLRFRFLYTFLKKNLDKKVMIFFSTSTSARFHAELLKRLRIPALTMHSRQRREKFISTFFKFADMYEGILCTTDAAGRDLDIPPSVDYVLQFEPPDDPSEYILRIARISCDSDRIGRSVLFLNPGEQGFLKYYNSAAITVSEFELPKLAENQLQIENEVNESARLLQFAKDAYGSYLISYASHGFRDVYNVHDLNKKDVAEAFGLLEIPNGDNEDGEESTYGGSLQVVSNTKGKKSTWELTKKHKTKSWMKGEKSWPHAQIKIHPKFKGESSYQKEEEEEID